MPRHSAGFIKRLLKRIALQVFGVMLMPGPLDCATAINGWRDHRRMSLGKRVFRSLDCLAEGMERALLSLQFTPAQVPRGDGLRDSGSKPGEVSWCV